MLIFLVATWSTWCQSISTFSKPRFSKRRSKKDFYYLPLVHLLVLHKQSQSLFPLMNSIWNLCIDSINMNNRNNSLTHLKRLFKSIFTDNCLLTIACSDVEYGLSIIALHNPLWIAMYFMVLGRFYEFWFLKWSVRKLILLRTIISCRCRELYIKPWILCPTFDHTL